MKAISLFSIALVFVLSACSITPAPVIDAPTPVLPTNILPATENPVAPATDTPQPASRFQSFPGTNCCSARMIEAGVYELPSWLGIPSLQTIELTR